MLYKLSSDFNITTSRKPSQITRRFAQFLKHYFNTTYTNRGKTSFTKVINETRNNGKSILLVINETKGNPSSINIYNLEKSVEEAWINIYINISLPQENNTINTDSGSIILINKSRKLDELCDNFSQIKTSEKIRENCIIITDEENIRAEFIDKKGNNTKFKVFIKGFKVNE